MEHIKISSPEIIQRASEQKKDASEAEALLWTQLRNRHMAGKIILRARNVLMKITEKYSCH